jgi:two-component system, OmpR family, sensor histidine kinase KdpD
MALFYLLCVFLTSAFSGLTPAILASLLSIVAQDYFFIKPYMSYGPPNLQDILSLFVLLIVIILTSYFSSRLRQKTSEAKRREMESFTLYTISRDLEGSTDLDTCLKTLIERARDAFGINILFFLSDSKNNEALKFYSDNPEDIIDNKTIETASWCFEHSEESGSNTGIYSASRETFFPLITAISKLGVMAIRN